MNTKASSRSRAASLACAIVVLQQMAANASVIEIFRVERRASYFIVESPNQVDFQDGLESVSR